MAPDTRHFDGVQAPAVSTRGFFISLESVDGLGKTTQVRLLGKALEDAGHRLYSTKEPGDQFMGSNVAAGIRHLLFTDPSTKRMRPGVGDLLFLADHIQNAGDVREKVDEGYVVLADRYADSQFAYGACPSKQTPPWALAAYAAHYGIVPDLTVLLRARGPMVSVPFPAPTRGFKMVEDLSWALKRAKTRTDHEAGKQEGKAWNDVEDQRLIQTAYERYLVGQPRTLVVDVWEDTEIGDIHQTILVDVLYRLVNVPRRTEELPSPYEALIPQKVA
jgi:thymidylate kinase